MADNFAVTAGSGTTIAADEVTWASVAAKMQIVKLGIGADGAIDGLASDTTPVPTKLLPQTAGGLSIYRNLDLDETGQSIKGSAGQLYGGVCYNSNAALRFLKLYNKATAPTVGSDTPVITIPLKPQDATDLGAFLNGVAFSLGIGAGATTAVADADTGAPGANEVVVNLFYK